MANEQKIAIDALLGISRSLSRIADSLGELKTAFLQDRRANARESRMQKRMQGAGRTIVGESSVQPGVKVATRTPSVNVTLDSKTAKENVRDVLGGKYVP